MENFLIFSVYVILVISLLFLMYYIIKIDKPIIKKIIVDDDRYQEEFQGRVKLQHINRKLQGIIDSKDKEIQTLKRKNECLEDEIEKWKKSFERSFQKQNTYKGLI